MLAFEWSKSYVKGNATERLHNILLDFAQQR